MLELSKAPDVLNNSTDTKPSENALVREAQLIWQGVSSAPEYLANSLSAEERGHTAMTALFSAGLTLGIACLKRNPSLAWTATRVVGPAMAVPLLSDLDMRTRVLGSAMADNWNSDRNWKQNVGIARESIGRFTADFAISALASGAAERFGRSYFSVRTPGVSALPELNREGLLSNWQKHMDGEIVSYKINSPQGGGMRQVDLFLPQNLATTGEALIKTGETGKAGGPTGLLIAQDGLKIDFGKLRELRAPEHGLIDLKADLVADKSSNYVAAFTHPQRFRVVPGVNLSAWQHDTGLIKKNGWFAPHTPYSDAAFVADVQATLSGILKTERTVLAGYSSGAILNNEVAARLGPQKVQGLISVASTVTGAELAPQAGQFRLVIRDNFDPTLPQTGGAGGKAKILANLGHRQVLNSVPESQINHGLKPYATLDIKSQVHEPHPGVSMQKFVADGAPVLSYIKTNNGTHSWSAIAEAHSVAPRTIPAGETPALNLSQMVKEIVAGDLKRFAH